jgi:hypothetical protein
MATDAFDAQGRRKLKTVGSTTTDFTALANGRFEASGGNDLLAVIPSGFDPKPDVGWNAEEVASRSIWTLFRLLAV